LENGICLFQILGDTHPQPGDRCIATVAISISDEYGPVRLRKGAGGFEAGSTVRPREQTTTRRIKCAALARALQNYTSTATAGCTTVSRQCPWSVVRLPEIVEFCTNRRRELREPNRVSTASRVFDCVCHDSEAILR
jgi:hypothetical protein